MESKSETLSVVDTQSKNSRRLEQHFRDMPFREIQESMRRSFQPLVDLGELLQHAVESLSKKLAYANEVFKESIAPALLELSRKLEKLPARIRDAVILLGQHGWYIDLEMPMPALWELENALANGSVCEAEETLVNYFEDRLSSIEESISAKFPLRAHLFHSAFEAHRRGEYSLSVPVLLAQADGICKETVDQYLFIRHDKKPRTAIYVEQVSKGSIMVPLLSPLATVLPIAATEKERPEGFTQLNRHMVLHGESLDYGTKINSLKAISLVNYVAQALPACETIRTESCAST